MGLNHYEYTRVNRAEARPGLGGGWMDCSRVSLCATYQGRHCVIAETPPSCNFHAFAQRRDQLDMNAGSFF